MIADVLQCLNKLVSLNVTNYAQLLAYFQRVNDTESIVQGTGVSSSLLLFKHYRSVATCSYISKLTRIELTL